MDLLAKQKLLDNLYIKYRVALSDSGINEEIIKGEGNIYSRLAVISEAPQVSKADSTAITAFLSSIGVNAKSAYITSVVKFIPKTVSSKTGKQVGRPPSKNEVELSAPFLFEELKIVEPKVAVTFGSMALSAVTGDNNIKLKHFHGKLIEISGLILFPLYNPKSVHYIKDLDEINEKDLYLLKTVLETIVTVK